MIRLAVVHSPVGPTKGPGLDEDIQAPGLENEFTDTGHQKFDSFFPYGGQGKDLPNVTDPKIRPSIGIDFDGTITEDPEFFKDLIKNLVKHKGRCYLVTARPIQEKSIVEGYCKRYGLNFDSMHFFPIGYNYNIENWDPKNDIILGNWKAKVLNRLNADAMIEDNQTYINIIKDKCPNIIMFRPVLR